MSVAFAFLFSTLLFFLVFHLFSVFFADIVVIHGSHTSFPSGSFSLHDGSPYSVWEYISRYGHFLDACRINARRIVDDLPSIYDSCFDMNRNTAVGG